jgi:hypothetical protein
LQIVLDAVVHFPKRPLFLVQCVFEVRVIAPDGFGQLDEGFGSIADLAGGARHIQIGRGAVTLCKAHDGGTKITDMPCDQQLAATKATTSLTAHFRAGNTAGCVHSSSVISPQRARAFPDTSFQVPAI